MIVLGVIYYLCSAGLVIAGVVSGSPVLIVAGIAGVVTLFI